jgi:hypothetical protein
MNTKKTARVAGFIGALGASALLLGAAANTTGAYFTDSHDGAINSSTGQVKVDTTDLQLNFDNLLPGEYKTQRVDYTARGTGSEDIWMVFPTDGTAEALVGRPDDSAGGGLGRYGHLKVTSTGGASFVSNNLNRNRLDDNSAPCGVDGNGWGGSNAEAANRADYDVPYCAPANAILLQSGMSAGDTGYSNVEFGITKLSRGQNAPHAQVAKFKIVATQHGIRPDNPNN